MYVLCKYFINHSNGIYYAVSRHNFKLGDAKKMNFQMINFSQIEDIQNQNVEAFLTNLTDRNDLYHFPKNYCQYVADNAIELLDIALNIKDNLLPIKNDISRKAFLILSNSPKKVMRKLLIDGNFLIKSTIVLEQLHRYTSFILAKELVSRIASIFNNIIIKTKDRNIIIDSIGFLTQMIPFIEDESVFNFFCLVVSTEDDFKEMQLFLSQVNLYDFLINELPNEKETNFEKEKNIFHIIKICLQNPILQSSFQKEEVLNKLFDRLKKRKYIFTNLQKQSDYGDKKIAILNEIYESLSFLVCKKLIDKMNPLFSQSIEIIKLFYNSIYTMPNADITSIDCCAHKFIRKYHICVFDLISKVGVLKADIINEDSQNILIKTIERIIHVFPNSTNLIVAAFRVVKSSLHSSTFATKMVDSLMPLMISLAKSKTKTASSAAATHFLADMEHTKKVSKMISNFLTLNEEYMSFYNSCFKNYMEHAYVPYGGPVVKFSSIEIEKIKKKENIDGSKIHIVT